VGEGEGCLTMPNPTRLIPADSIARARVYLAAKKMLEADMFHEAALRYLEAEALIERTVIGEPELAPRMAFLRSRCVARTTDAVAQFRSEAAPLLDESAPEGRTP